MAEFLSEDKIKTTMTLRQMLAGLWPFAKRNPVLLTASALSVVGVGITSRLLPNLIGRAVDLGIQNGRLQVVREIALWFLGVEILHTFLMFQSQFLFNWFGNRMLTHLRAELLNHTQHLPLDYFNRTPLGRTVTRLTNDTATLGEVFTDGLISLIEAGIILLSIVIAMLLISWKLTLVTLISAPVFLYAAFKITESIRLILRDSKTKLSVLNSYVAENLNGIKVIQIFARTGRNHGRFLQLSREYRDVALDSIKSYAKMQPIMNIFNGVTITAALYYGGYLGHEGWLPLGAMVAFLMHTQDVIHPLRDMLEKFQQFQNSLTSAERVFQLFDEKEENTATGLEIQTPRGDLHFEHVRFRYAPELPWVLEDFDLQIQAGQSVAIVGRTGSGKSTLIALLQRFYDLQGPDNGRILLDQVPLEQLSRRALRRTIGVVQQDNFIFRGTVRDNLHLGDTSVTDEQLWQALRAVGSPAWLERAGRNLDTWVEEKGANLSVGERQLIAFARILVFSPPLLVLDEATANIDSESELLIQQATQKIIQGRTSIIIAHRLSTIRECNLIVVLDQGRIREKGTHAELLRHNGQYAHLAEAGVKFTATEA